MTQPTELPRDGDSRLDQFGRTEIFYAGHWNEAWMISADGALAYLAREKEKAQEKEVA